MDTQGYIWFSGGFPIPNAPSLNGALLVRLDERGDARASGVLRVRAGAQKVLLVTDGTAQANCADADGDGVGGLVRLTVGLRDVRTGATYTGVIAPLVGDVDESGRFKVRFSFERGEPTDRIFEGWLLAPFFDRRH